MTRSIKLKVARYRRLGCSASLARRLGRFRISHRRPLYSPGLTSATGTNLTGNEGPRSTWQFSGDG